MSLCVSATKRTDLETEWIDILSGEQGVLRGGRCLQLGGREDRQDLVQELSAVSRRLPLWQYVPPTLWTSSSVRFFSDLSLKGCFGPERRVRLSASSLTVMAEMVASWGRMRVVRPLT